MRTLNALLDSGAERWPERTALLVEEGHHSAAPHPHEAREKGEHVVTFGELRDCVLRAAALMRSKGIGRGDRVAILHRNGLGFVTAYFALARLGAAAVPINFMVQKAEELRFMLQDSGAKAVVTQRAFLREVRRAVEGAEGLSTVWITDGKAPEAEDFWTALRASSPEEGGGDAEPGDVAAVLYTSGTTGHPKGVMLTHENLVSNCDDSIRFFGLREGEDVFPCLLPMFHTFAWTVCVLIPLRLGDPNLVISSITPPAPWLMRMGRHRATVFVAVPQIYAVLAKQAVGFKRWLLRLFCFRGVRFCVSGAGPLPVPVAKAFREVLGHDVLEGYGLTETSPVVTVNPPGRMRLGAAGLPIPNVRLRTVDEAGRELAQGEEGEVCVSGPCVMKGYLNQPEATRETLSADGWLRTGDIGLVDSEGYLHIRDRKKDMIIVKGLKVFSAQVETVLLSHPAVLEAAVIGIPGEDGDETIKAFVVLKPGAAADRAALLHHCRQKLDAYKRPRDVEVVSELPKNALQKVLKRVLRQAELEKRGGGR